jgi:hypothetical protein
MTSIGNKGDVVACCKTPQDVNVQLPEPSLADNLTGDYIEQVEPELVLAKRIV